MLNESEVRFDLSTALVQDVEFEDLRARILARYLDSLPEGTRVLFSGCGGISRRLAVCHGPSLARHRAAFTDGEVTVSGEFCGHALLPVDQAVAFDPEYVLLMTGTYESAMRRRLSGLPSERLTGLRQVVCDLVADIDRLEAMERILVTADRIVAELGKAFKSDDKTLCVVDPDLSGSNLSLLAELRRNSWRVALFTRRNVQTSRPLDRLVAEGYADWFYEASSYESIRLMLRHILMGYCFRVVWLWVFHVTLPFVARCVQSSAGPVV
ncbi:MAG: hypothetical protein Q7U56_01995, partial [Humidesulfovibrio sp.]|nr:hypothetical protein [Humidesulfovibrio sp.]